MSYIVRDYLRNGSNQINLHGGNCGCSDCMSGYGTDGSMDSKSMDNKSMDSKSMDSHSMDSQYSSAHHNCDCEHCEEGMEHVNELMSGGNIFDTISNAMPFLLNFVPLVGPVLSRTAQGVLDVLDPYRKNPQHPQAPQLPPPPPFVPFKTDYSKQQLSLKDRINKAQGKGLKKNVHFKKGSVEMKEKMAYLRSLKRQ